MIVEVFMPKMSDHMESGVIVGWLCQENQAVEKGQPLFELETDKATAELESPASGFLRGIRVGVIAGVDVPVGDTIAFITSSLDEVVPKLPPFGGALPTVSVPNTPSPAVRISSGPVIEAEADGVVRATPVVRKLARELGLDIAQIKATGSGGRVTEADLHSFMAAKKSAEQVQSTHPVPASVEPVKITPVALSIANELGVEPALVKGSGPNHLITKKDVQEFALSTQPGVDRAETGPDGQWLELNKTQLLTGQRMLESVQTAPQFILTTHADMTRVLDLRAAVGAQVEADAGVRLSVTGILVKVVSIALKRHPRLNSSFVNGRIKLHSQINIGVAVGTEAGLFVPVISNPDLKTLAEITRDLKGFQEKATRQRFAPQDFAGSTFTISNLGMYGIDQFQAIINPPESAILAVGRIIQTPVGLPDGQLALRPMMALTLTIDHRSLDGMQGAKFLATVKECLEQPYLIL